MAVVDTIKEGPSRNYEYSNLELAARYEHETPSSSFLMSPTRFLPLKSIPIKKRPRKKIYSDLDRNYEYQNGARSTGNFSNHDDDDDDDREDDSTRCDDNGNWKNKPTTKLYKYYSKLIPIVKKRKRSVFIGKDEDEKETGSNHNSCDDHTQTASANHIHSMGNGFVPAATADDDANDNDRSDLAIGIKSSPSVLSSQARVLDTVMDKKNNATAFLLDSLEYKYYNHNPLPTIQESSQNSIDKKQTKPTDMIVRTTATRARSDCDYTYKTQSFASMIYKRIQVQWNMSDGTTRWYTGIIQSCSGDGSEAILVYDEEGNNPVLLDAHEPPKWRSMPTSPDCNNNGSDNSISNSNKRYQQQRTTDCYSLLSELSPRVACVSSDDDDCSSLASTDTVRNTTDTASFVAIRTFSPSKSMALKKRKKDTEQRLSSLSSASTTTTATATTTTLIDLTTSPVSTKTLDNDSDALAIVDYYCQGVVTKESEKKTEKQSKLDRVNHKTKKKSEHKHEYKHKQLRDLEAAKIKTKNEG